MKTIKKILYFIACALVVLTTSCNDFLDKEPTSTITDGNYFSSADQLDAYLNSIYSDVLPSHDAWGYGLFQGDNATDNMAGKNYDNRYVPGEWRVSQTGGTWNFDLISKCNYFFDKVLPKAETGGINGRSELINHYIGEMYFLRASVYFSRLQSLGDYPIITTQLSDEMEVLVEASKRYPRNEVARFIIQDLDRAIELMGNKIENRKTRINQDAALLLKSRVALFEGTWLKYFKGTAFVPNGPEWPGASKDYNKGYRYPSGDIDQEIAYFLDIAIVASAAVSERFTLTNNTGTIQQSQNEAVNPYMNMFGDIDLSSYSEVLLWREYNKDFRVNHNVVNMAQRGGNGVGLTRGMVDGFLMNDGLPIYASQNYNGDEDLTSVRAGRDSRLFLFLKEPGQLNVLYENPIGDHARIIEGIPDILNSSEPELYSTGYAIRKGNNYDQSHCANGGAFTGAISYRGVEAYLNYIEAYYERHGNLNDIAANYWKKIRERAKVDQDYNKTIANTNMTIESQNDWGAYSGGRLIDAMLFNIRRERRCELMAEGLRYMDLRRWRAMDQMLSIPYHIEGFKLWGTMQNWYSGKLVHGMANDKSNVSSPDRSEYLRPYEITDKSLAKDGYRWAMAHYLDPIAIQHILVSSQDGDYTTSPIYQNPYWPLQANDGALK